LKRAVFLDRDGTLIELVHHLTKPTEVRIFPQAAEALCALRAHGYVCVIVTNQSAIGRGMLTEAGLGEVHDELSRQLSACGAAVDGFYFCPLKPLQEDPTVIEHPDRKPGPGMLQRAAAELGIDLSQSWMIGDTVSDVLAGKNAGCRGSILVKTGYGARAAATYAERADYVADDVGAAARLILDQDRAPGAAVRSE
jgi:D-glycero-D-manno-heptose 1,7-bisphosphate phosphatase